VKRVLIYKRTHIGDPDNQGQFGIHDCMGEVRDREFDAVIGIGGTSPEPFSYGIDRRLNWVGIGPHKFPGKPGHRGSLVVFDHFLLREHLGPVLDQLAPRLARHMYETNRRHVMSDGLGEEILAEIKRILDLGRRAPPSPIRPIASKADARVSRCNRRDRQCKRGPR
jgi:hypothetical protein